MGRHFAAAGLLALGVAGVLAEAAPPAPERVQLDVVLDRAAWYLDYFVDEFENVVAEESYVQDSTMLLPSFSTTGGGRGGAFPPPPSPSDSARARHRELRSDFLLVKSPEHLDCQADMVRTTVVIPVEDLDPPVCRRV